jgi:hypothetical protein
MSPCRIAVKPLIVFSIPVVFLNFRALEAYQGVYQFLWHQFEICKIQTLSLLWMEPLTPNSSCFSNSNRKLSQVNG